MKKIIAILVFMIGVACCYAQPFPLDYSYVGYRMSEQPIPNVDVKVYGDGIMVIKVHVYRKPLIMWLR